MRRLGLVLVATALFSGLLLASPTGGTPAYASPQNGGGDQGIGWQYSETANGYYRQPSDEGSPDGGGGTGIATVFTDYGAPGESLSCPEGDRRFNCNRAGTNDTDSIWCNPEPDEPGGLPRYPYITYNRDVNGNQVGRWYVVPGDAGAGCVEPTEDNFIPMEEFSVTINCQLFQPLGPPEIALSPEARTFVNFETIVSTNYPTNLDGYESGGDCVNDIDQPAIVSSTQDSTTLEIPIHINRPGGGLDGLITAEASYRWTFKEGDEVVGSAPGKGSPYEEGRYPEENPGYYITHAYSTTGVHAITMTVNWTGTVTVQGPGIVPQTEEIEPVEATNTVEIDVDEAQSVITR